jgi:hypothetical protein
MERGETQTEGFFFNPYLYTVLSSRRRLPIPAYKTNNLLREVVLHPPSPFGEGQGVRMRG